MYDVLKPKPPSCLSWVLATNEASIHATTNTLTLTYNFTYNLQLSFKCQPVVFLWCQPSETTHHAQRPGRGISAIMASPPASAKDGCTRQPGGNATRHWHCGFLAQPQRTTARNGRDERCRPQRLHCKTVMKKWGRYCEWLKISLNHLFKMREN